MADVDCNEEVWRHVVGYEGMYSVSSLGRVRSEAGPGRGARMRKLVPNTRGYLTIMLSRNGKTKYFAVARLVAAAFIGPIPDGMEVCHNDGKRANNRASNLRYDTHLENMKDALRHGTFAVGERSWRAKLTLKQVEEIRSSSLSGLKLAAMYGIAHSQVYNIKNGKSWKSPPP